MKNEHQDGMPLVSCIIPSYKRCDTVNRAIDSVLAQTYTNVEVCLVDDNVPNDEYSNQLKKALEKYANNPRVRYIPQEKHINGAVARNVGISESKGEYIAFLDDDDEWLPEKIEKQVELLNKRPDIGGVSCLYMLYRNGEETRRCSPYSGNNLQFKVLSRQIAIYTSTFICRRQVIEESKGFDPHLLRHQDLQMFTDFLNYSKIEPINEYLVILHTDSEINQPNVNRLIDIKDKYFMSVNDTISRYTKNDQKRIRNAHYFEIALMALREHKLDIFFKYLFKVGFSFVSYVDLVNRIRRR